jgi:hypothetical protein
MKQHRSLKGTTRWYRIVDGEVERCHRRPDEILDSSWQRGLGPIDNAHCAAISSSTLKGIPKSPIQRERMRAAKLGITKSPEHRQAMSQAHINRHKQIHRLMSEHGIKWSDACQLYKQNNKQNNK